MSLQLLSGVGCQELERNPLYQRSHEKEAQFVPEASRTVFIQAGGPSRDQLSPMRRTLSMKALLVIALEVRLLFGLNDPLVVTELEEDGV